MSEFKRPREPMFNFTEKAPAYLAGLFIAIQAIMMVMPSSLLRPIDRFGVLRPLGTPGADSVSHSVSLIGHGFLHGGWGHVLLNSGMIIVFGIAAIRGSKALATMRGKAAQASRDFLVIFFVFIFKGPVESFRRNAHTSGENPIDFGHDGGFIFP